MFRKRVFPLFLLVVCISGLLAGCTININVGNPAEDATKETDSKTIFDYIFNSGKEKMMYESRATIYISNRPATDTAISSSDFGVSKRLAATYAAILQTRTVQDEIRKEYPAVEYELSLESINDTEAFEIIATGTNPEQLEEICNTAASVFCKKLSEVVAGVSCKVVNRATSAQRVGAN